MKDKTLSIKLNKSLLALNEGPFTPVEQTLQTPVDAPNQNSYFAFPSSSSQHESGFSSQTHDNDSDDVMTDVDEPSSMPGPKVLRNYTVSFNATFDQILMNIYSHILSLPTTTPFSGFIPPSGLVSRVANETLQKMIAESDPMGESSIVTFDSQGTLDHEQLRNNATAPIILQLIRKRLLDLCSAQKTPKSWGGSNPAATVTSIQIAVPLTNNNLSLQNNSIYSGSGLRQSSISTLSLNEHNSASYQSQTSQAAQTAALANSRSRSSSLNLRKHSLTRNNSHTGSSWLHVGNLANVRSGGNLGMNADFAASSDSLQSMNDFVPHAFLTRTASSQSNLGNGGAPSIAASGFNPMMMDYQTPPSSSKSSISQESSSPSMFQREGACLFLPGSAGSTSDNESNGNSFSRARSLSRGANACSFPKPLTINTDVGHHNFSNPHTPGFGGSALGETLHSPFVSANPVSEDFEYFGHGNNSTSTVLENVSPNVSALRSGFHPSETSTKEGTGNKVNIPMEYSLSEKKRDSLKMKRGIH